MEYRGKQIQDRLSEENSYLLETVHGVDHLDLSMSDLDNLKRRLKESIEGLNYIQCVPGKTAANPRIRIDTYEGYNSDYVEDDPYCEVSFVYDEMESEEAFIRRVHEERAKIDLQIEKELEKKRKQDLKKEAVAKNRIEEMVAELRRKGYSVEPPM